MNKVIFIPIFLIFISLNSFSANHNCKVVDNFKRCDVLIESNALNNNIPVFIYSYYKDNTNPTETIQNRQLPRPIVFLHGRGYARNLNGSSAMLEHADLTALFKQYKNKYIYIAPQDNIVQEDTGNIGNDYWIGANKRNWMEFLSEELIHYSKNNIIANYSNGFTVMGISMGAHGSLMLGASFPNIYSKSIALSPVFRSHHDEIGAHDEDVFFKSGQDNLIRYNYGKKLIEADATLPMNYFISIDENDFALDFNQFPYAKLAWDNLYELHDISTVNILKLHTEGTGHSMPYWRLATVEALSWLTSLY